MTADGNINAHAWAPDIYLMIVFNLETSADSCSAPENNRQQCLMHFQRGTWNLATDYSHSFSGN